MSVLGSIDAWIRRDALHHEEARKRGDMLRASLPGVGFLKFFGVFIIVPLILSEGMFVAGFPALPVPVVVLTLLGLLGIFYWRYFTHRKRIHVGAEANNASD